MNKRRRELLAALQPAVDVALKRAPVDSGVRVQAISADTTEIMIYGSIGGGGFFDDGTSVSAASVQKILGDVSTPNIYVRVNSGGGDVFDGVAIHTLLARHPAMVTVFVDGIAASAASFIAMSGDKIVIARNAMMMIHDGMTMAYGNADTMQRTAALLDKVSANIADMYAMRAGGRAEEWRALMTVNGEDGTWYTGQEAVEAGLADEATGDDEPEDVPTEDRARHTFARVQACIYGEQHEEDEIDPPEINGVDVRDDVASTMLAFLAERMKGQRA